MSQKIRDSRAWGVIVSVAAYVVATAVAVFVAQGGRAWTIPWPTLGLGTLVATVVVFAVSVVADNSSIYDPYWSVQPLAIAGYYLWTGWGHIDTRQIIVTVLVASLRTASDQQLLPGLARARAKRTFATCRSGSASARRTGR